MIQTAGHQLYQGEIMDISQFNPGMELKEKNHLIVSRTRKEPGVVCQMPKMCFFSDELPGWDKT